MLRINVFKSASGAVDYFNESLAGDYYSEEDQTIGLWGGKGAERLGLSGTVEKGVFQDLVNNRAPDGNHLRPGWSREGRSGFDFTFDVPKSVTLLHELTGDERILQAFEEACVETMEALESEAAVRVRKGQSNHDRTTGELTWSRFTHHSSRPVAGVSDPHLHAHFFVHNLSWDEKAAGFRALQASDIKGSAYYYEALHHSKVAAKLAKLGIGIERRGESWEVAGASEELLAKFSRRTAEIQAEIKRKGLDSDRLRSQIGAKSRSKKQEADIATLRQEWRSRLSEEEFHWLRDVLEGCEQPADSSARAQAAEKAIHFATEDLFGTKSVVEERRLVAKALRHSAGKANLAEIEQAIEKSDLRLRTKNGRRYFTTREVEAEEQAMLAFARKGQGGMTEIAPGQHAFQRDFLNLGQRAAVEHVLNSKDRVTAIRGAAGTGKTTLMKEAIEEMEKRGLKVRTFAPSSDASRLTLRKEGFHDAETLQMLLVNSKTQESVRGGVIWVDEAGMIGTRDMVKLFRVAREQRARIILSGDYKQHAAVQRGDALRLLVEQKAIRTREVTKILRQRGQYKQAIEELSRGRTEEGFEILEGLQAIREIRNDEERNQRVAEDYLRLTGQGRTTLVVSPTHKEANHVTSRIREGLREKGTLKSGERDVYRQINRHWGNGTKSDAASYREGDIIQFVRPAPGFQIGDRLEITGKNEDGIPEYRHLGGRVGDKTLPLDKPERFQVYTQTQIGISEGEKIRITQGGTLPNRYRLENGSFHEVKRVTANGELELKNGVVLPKHWGNFNYAYVSTSYASQGKTVDEVLISQSTDSLPASNREQFYVSSSRGRENLRIYTDSKRELFEAVGMSQERIAALETKPLQAEPKNSRKKSAPQKSETKSNPVKAPTKPPSKKNPPPKAPLKKPPTPKPPSAPPPRLGR